MPRKSGSVISLLALATVLAICGSSQALAADAVSYVKDVKPFLAKYCIECHTQAKAQGGVALDSYQAMVRGNDPVIRPNQPDRSDLVKVLSAAAGRKRMPPTKATARPTAEEIAMIRAWVQAGGRDDSNGDKKDGDSQKQGTAPPEDKGRSDARPALLGALTAGHSFDSGP